jgi:hypothetical protein
VEITVVNAPCGAGKSYDAALTMTSVPGKYVCVIDRHEAIDEYAGTLRGLSDTVPLRIIRKEETFHGYVGVRQQIATLTDIYAECPHIIVD